MARLFDEMRRGFTIAPWNDPLKLRELIHDCLHTQPVPVFSVDDIAKQAWPMGALRYEYDQPINIPYPRIFIEYRVPPPTPHPKQIHGALVFYATEEPGKIVLVMLPASTNANRLPDMGAFIITVAIDDYGLPTEKDSWLSLSPGCKKTGSAEARSEYAYAFTQPILLALALLNCRNIQTPQKIPDAPLNKKWLRKNTYPLVEYHTLKLQLPSTRNGSTNSTDPGATGNHKRLHMARGHFAHYGPEGKLFGRLEGTFWIPAHLKGNKEKGVLLKNYSISPSKDE